MLNLVLHKTSFENQILTFAADIRSIPRCLAIDSQTLGSGEAICHVPSMAVILDGSIEVEGRLFWEGRVTRVLDRWRLEAVD